MIDFEHMFSLLKRIDPKYRQCCEIINEQIELNENSNDRRINKLIKTYYPNSNFEEIRNIRADFLKKIPNARARDEKWLYAVLRWYLNGNIPKNEINRLNKFLGWLHKNKFYANDAIETSDWSLFRFEDIKYAYDKLFLNTNNINKNNTSNNYNKKQNINGFVIRRIDTEEEASMLGYTFFNKEWCIFDDANNMKVREGCKVINIDSFIYTDCPAAPGACCRSQGPSRWQRMRDSCSGQDGCSGRSSAGLGL